MQHTDLPIKQRRNFTRIKENLKMQNLLKKNKSISCPEGI
jgi:hypothetical protein